MHIVCMYVCMLSRYRTNSVHVQGNNIIILFTSYNTCTTLNCILYVQRNLLYLYKSDDLCHLNIVKPLWLSTCVVLKGHLTLSSSLQEGDTQMYFKISAHKFLPSLFMCKEFIHIPSNKTKVIN